MDFGNHFASTFDNIIHDHLADTISLSHPTMGTTTIQAHWVDNSDEEELNDRSDDYFPVMKVKSGDYAWFKDRLVTITYNGKNYKVYDDMPADKLRYSITMKDARD